MPQQDGVQDHPGGSQRAEQGPMWSTVFVFYTIAWQKSPAQNLAIRETLCSEAWMQLFLFQFISVPLILAFFLKANQGL